MSIPLLTTKLNIPPSRTDLVHSPRLIEHLNTGLSHRDSEQGKSFGVQGFMFFFPYQHNYIACACRSTYLSTMENWDQKNRKLECTGM